VQLIAHVVSIRRQSKLEGMNDFSMVFARAYGRYSSAPKSHLAPRGRGSPSKSVSIADVQSAASRIENGVRSVKW